jgi:UDP-N-acetylbacillosamine N-acetyltransferase
MIGAGGHTRSLINVLELNGIVIKGIFDDHIKSGREFINGYSVLGRLKDVPKSAKLVFSTGDNGLRERWLKTYRTQVFTGLICHPTAILEKRIEVGDCNQVMAGAYINTNVTLGRNNLLNTNCVLEHEVTVGDHNHIAVGAVVCGRVRIGNRCFLGAGAVIIDKKSLCDDVIIGANSVVINDIREPGTYVGNPARKVK